MTRLQGFVVAVSGLLLLHGLGMIHQAIGVGLTILLGLDLLLQGVRDLRDRR